MENTHETAAVAERPEAVEKETVPAQPMTMPQAILWNAVIIGLCVIIGAFIVAHGPFGGSEGDKPVPTVAADIRKVTIDGEPYIGQADAPVTLAYWSDFQCPYCKKFQSETLPSIVKEYVDTGKVKVVFKDFAFLGEHSTIAAIYGRAVWALYPEKYFLWHEAMYKAQDAENAGFGDEASIQKLIATISGLDGAKLAADVRANAAAYQAKMETDRAEATNFGIGGTPSFITGKTLIPGVAPFATFQQAFDKQLK